MKKEIVCGSIAVCSTALPILRMGIVAALIATASTLANGMFHYAMISCLSGSILFFLYVFTESVSYGADIERWADNLYTTHESQSEWAYKFVGNIAGPALLLLGTPYFLKVQGYERYGLFIVSLIILWGAIRLCGQWIHEKLFP